MPSLLPISTLLQVADICQYLAANDIDKDNQLNAGAIAPSLALQIFNAKTVVRWVYSLNPNDTSLVQTGIYLYQLLGSYAIKAQRILNSVLAGAPTLTGPSNQTVSEGSNATFTVTVTGGIGPFTYAWYDHLGNLIPGATAATYIFPNAQLIDNDKYFYVKVTDSIGRQAVSGLAFLTVTAVITGFLYYSSTDPGPTLLSNSDPFTYQSSYIITHNAAISIPISVAAASNQFLVAKVPSGESAKTTWFNTNLNQGVIPPPADFVFATPVTFGGFTYYYTKQLVSLDPTQPLILS